MNDGKSENENIKAMKKEYEEQEMNSAQFDMMKKRIAQAKAVRRRAKKMRTIRQWSVVAATLVIFVTLPNTSKTVAHAMEGIPLLGRLVSVVTFRNYQYEGDRNQADIQVPELVAEGFGTVPSQEQTDAGENGVTAEPDGEAAEKLKRTTEEINREIQQITDELVKEFEANLDEEQGYQDVLVKSEELAVTEDYFTLKLICYQGAGSGAEWDYFYTIDLNTGERLQLKDLFKEGEDYITPISENIKEQMRSQMAADDNIYYWVDEKEIPEWNFDKITEETSFYLNQDGHIVISFNEGDVAPMYMGCVEFEIPDAVTETLRR